jgi:hypothetical protein
MKTFFTLTLGIIVGLLTTHYYQSTKNDYFNNLYVQYSAINYEQLTEKQFERKWISAEQAWCFNTENKNNCNLAASLNKEEISTEMQMIALHQKLVKWYPKAKSTMHQVQLWALSTWEKQASQLNKLLNDFNKTAT